MDLRPTVDQETFLLFQRGNEDAAMRIVALFEDRLIGYLCLRTRDRDTAEDIAQEVFLEAFLSRRKIRNAESLRGWLFTVASRKASRHRGHAHKVPIADLSWEDDTREEGVTPGDIPMLREEVFSHLTQAMDTLSDRDRQLVALRYFGQLSIKELAETLQMPMGSVGVTLDRALKKLRKELEAKGFSPGDGLV